MLGISSQPAVAAICAVSRLQHGSEIGPQRVTGKQVVLFNDTFNTYNYPEVSIAATEVLEAAGFEVLLPGHYCCGRPMISKGLVNEARSAARDCVEKLFPLLKRGIPIVGLEPSCLLTLRDELFDTAARRTACRSIAAQRSLFEEFIAKLARDGTLNLNIQQALGKVLLHGHCHQKALVGRDHRNKHWPPSAVRSTEVDSGCCGMAGSFGYEAEHYDVSLAMGERRLLPAVREVADDTTIVAAGVSCRQQIKHGTGRRCALHPAETMHRALFPDKPRSKSRGFGKAEAN